MPDKSLAVATYAAGVSLAAITLIYVFGPSYLSDETSISSSRAARKKGAVGLLNPANDCFINSVLQAFAGLSGLNSYLVLEAHMRNLSVRASNGVEGDTFSSQDARLVDLQSGIVTQALRDLLESLTERPGYKKSISARNFIAALERGFNQRISRQQQDAQEFLQLVLERLSEEHHASERLRHNSTSQTQSSPIRSSVDRGNDCANDEGQSGVCEDGDVASVSQRPTTSTHGDTPHGRDSLSMQEPENTRHKGAQGFPFEGMLESRIECQTCHFRPQPRKSSFVTLTLHVPQRSWTTLNDCFDGLFKTENVDDFKCDKCLLQHAADVRFRELGAARTDERKARIESELRELQQAILHAPEAALEHIAMPDAKGVPKRRISKHVRVTAFPEILAIHLSRSVYDIASTSTKNSAKVAFPEHLALGGILDREDYKLFGVVTHKGGHNSGHYETFRRQIQDASCSTLNTSHSEVAESVTPPSGPSVTNPPSSEAVASAEASSVAEPSVVPPKLSNADTDASTAPKARRAPRKEKSQGRWWRISDDKVRESKMSEVLGMQSEAYLLFYELDRKGNAGR
ncbi:MAG: hypothetical protein M1833_004936 [Piccolia ochrophora]|nr:MAG: hypothetical protein M1833_004936 [Piccolia ochrophora]